MNASKSTTGGGENPNPPNRSKSREEHEKTPAYAKDWDDYVLATWVNSEPDCPICGTRGQFGLSHEPHDKLITDDLERSAATAKMNQRCETCGYEITFSIMPFLKWMKQS